jgi:hypothetical protein
MGRRNRFLEIDSWTPEKFTNPWNLFLGSLKVYKFGLRPLISTKLMKGKDEEQCRPLQLEIAVSTIQRQQPENSFFVKLSFFLIICWEQYIVCTVIVV